MNIPDEEDAVEAKMLCTLSINSAQASLASLAITWEDFKAHCDGDTHYQNLITKIKTGTFADCFTLEEPDIKA